MSSFQVKLGFLMKGHTHEDVDQLFSRISTHTAKHNVPTLSSLLNHIPQAYNKPNTTADRIQTVYNIKDWLFPCLNKIANHSQPHQFKITKKEGKAVLSTKKWSSNDEWQSTTGEEHILKCHPQGQPAPTKRQDISLHLNNIRRDMPKYQTLLNGTEQEEWRDLLNELEEGGTYIFQSSNGV